MGFDVLAVGDLNCDLVLTDVSRPPMVNTEVLAETYRFTLGGSTGIFAAVLGSLGAQVGFVGLTGQDRHGGFLRRALASHHVDLGGLLSDPHIQTGLTISLMCQGDRALVTVLGSIACLREQDIPWDYVGQARHLHVGQYYLQTGLRLAMPKVFAEARRMGLTTSLDVGWDPVEEWDWPSVATLLPLIDVFLLNETEALHLTGRQDTESALADLVAAGANTATIKLGVRGAIVGCGMKRVYGAPFPVNAIDTTGAGDSFDAGFVHRWLAGDNLQSCLAFANACGALAVSRIGGADGACTETDVRAFMDLASVTRNCNSPCCYTDKQAWACPT